MAEERALRAQREAEWVRRFSLRNNCATEKRVIPPLFSRMLSSLRYNRRSKRCWTHSPYPSATTSCGMWCPPSHRDSLRSAKWNQTTPLTTWWGHTYQPVQCCNHHTVHLVEVISNHKVVASSLKLAIDSENLSRSPKQEYVRWKGEKCEIIAVVTAESPILNGASHYYYTLLPTVTSAQTPMWAGRDVGVRLLLQCCIILSYFISFRLNTSSSTTLKLTRLHNTCILAQYHKACTITRLQVINLLLCTAPLSWHPSPTSSATPAAAGVWLYTEQAVKPPTWSLPRKNWGATSSSKYGSHRTNHLMFVLVSP